MIISKYIKYYWKDFFDKQDFDEIEKILKSCVYYPTQDRIFYAFNLIPKNIKVVIIGQDPYYSIGKGEAMGLSFSVPINVKIPKSLENIFKNMLNFKHIKKYPNNGDLSILKYQGCFFINTALTVQAGKADSHKKYWNNFSINLIKYLSNLQPMVFVLWGKNALKLKDYIDIEKHKFVISSHPSPLGYYQKLGNYNSFNEQDNFGLINNALVELNYKKIYWNILNLI